MKFDAPPHDLVAEQAVIGSILIEQRSLVKVADFLRPDDFYSKKHGLVFQAMLDLFSKHSVIDLTTLGSELENRNELESIGGRAYLSEIIEIVPTSSHIIKYGEIVKEKATLRKLISAGEQIKALGFEEDKDLDETLEQAEKTIINISQQFLKDNFTHIKDVLHTTVDTIADIHERVERGETVTRGVPSGFFDLDKILSGFQPSDLVIIAARPSMGKTTFMMNIAQHVAIKEKKSIGVFSLEMSKEQLTERMLASLMAIDSWKLRTGKLTADDFANMSDKMDKLSQTRMFIDDSADVNMLEIRTKCRRLQAEHGLDMVMIDYLQLLKVGGGSNPYSNRVNEISEISRSLKVIGRELGVPVIALSQLSRAVDTRNDKRPQLSDLRDSGAIEQDADVVMFLYRDDYYNRDGTSEKPDVTEIIVSKHRNGPTGSIDLGFKKEQLKFINMDRTRADT